MVFNCPNLISETVPSGSRSVSVSWTIPTAVDDSGDVIVTSNYNPGATFPVGVSVVIYEFEDRAGNVATCTFNVVVSGNFTRQNFKYYFMKEMYPIFLSFRNFVINLIFS